MAATDHFDQLPEPIKKTVYEKSGSAAGLPDTLKAGLESLSGLDMSDVRVHYNSLKPVQLQAEAYTSGMDIHIAPGQERHLPSEAWHVVQQKQGRVKAPMAGAPINDDPALEKEADVMGAKAVVLGAGAP